jgi:hypothetical protein
MFLYLRPYGGHIPYVCLFVLNISARCYFALRLRLKNAQECYQVFLR